MTIELRVLSGTRAGQRDSFDKSLVTVGRHPLSDLRFDAEGDRDVSAKHAELRWDGRRWLLRDIGSTNGTFVNGERIAGERELREGDTISFGERGPRATVHVSPAAAPPGRPTTPASPRDVVVRRTTGERIAIAVKEHTRELRRLLVGIAALLVASVLGAYWIGHREARAREAQLDALGRRSDSLTTAFRGDIARMSGHVSGLDSALALALTESEALRARLRTQRGSGDAGDAAVVELSARLDRAESRRQALVSAARMDLTAIAATNSRAVVLIAVQMADGQSYTGSGFGLTTDGLVATNKHLLRDASGARAVKVAVIYSGTRRWLEAEIVQVSDADDIALVRIATGGSFPAVAGVAPSAARVQVGSPVAIIGYPLGIDTPMEGSGTRVTASPTLGPGTVSKILPAVLQVDAYAGKGSSGSPVLDRRGHVVGIVYGGAGESAGRIVYAVPSERLITQLPASARDIVR